MYLCVWSFRDAKKKRRKERIERKNKKRFILVCIAHMLQDNGISNFDLSHTSNFSIITAKTSTIKTGIIITFFLSLSWYFLI